MIAMPDGAMRLLVALVALILLARPVAAGTPDLALVLAIDGSASVDAAEFDLQVEGLAAAFRDGEVLRAIAAGPTGAILVTVLQWAGPGQQDHAVPWTRVDGPATAEAFAQALEAMPRFVSGATAIGAALRAAAALFAGIPAERRVIDVSGDGKDDRSLPLAAVRAAVLAQGITINGLAIDNEEPDLLAHYQSQVIGGPGAFALRAADYRDFAVAIREKLKREIGGALVAAAE